MSVYGFSSQQDVDRIADAVRKVEGGFFQPAGDMSGTARDDNQALVRLTGTASGGFSTGQVVIPAVDGKYVDVGEIRYREWPSNFRLARQHGITVDGKYPVYHGVAGGGSSVRVARVVSGTGNGPYHANEATVSANGQWSVSSIVISPIWRLPSAFAVPLADIPSGQYIIVYQLSNGSLVTYADGINTQQVVVTTFCDVNGLTVESKTITARGLTVG